MLTNFTMPLQEAEKMRLDEQATALCARLRSAPGWSRHDSNGWSLRVVRGGCGRVLVNRDETQHLGPGETSFTQAERLARWLARWGYRMVRVDAFYEGYDLALGPVVPEEAQP